MKSIIHSRVVLVITSVIVLMILLSLAQEINRRWQIDRQVSTLEQEASKLKKNVIELENLNQYFRTPDYQERLAREKLNYRAPGEQVVLIPELADTSSENVPENIQVPKKPIPLPLKWWNVFFVEPYEGADTAST